MKISKQKAAKIAALINEYNVVAEAQQKVTISSLASPLHAAMAMNSLLNKPKEVGTSLYGSIKTAKINNSARNYMFSLVEDGIITYTDFYQDYLNKIANANPTNLAPSVEKLSFLTIEEFKNHEKAIIALFNTNFIDIFNLGRQHQEVFQHNPMGAVLKKYANFGFPEDESCLNVINLAKKAYFSTFLSVSNAVMDEIETGEKSKNGLIDALRDRFSEASRNIERSLYQSAWKAYSVGNYHQICADKIEWVEWNSGHLSDDCFHCRAYHTGDAILRLPDGSEVPHIRNLDRVAYYVPALSFLASETPEILTHAGCRCQFVPYK